MDHGKLNVLIAAGWMDGLLCRAAIAATIIVATAIVIATAIANIATTIVTALLLLLLCTAHVNHLSCHVLCSFSYPSV
jgi:hypothetical protein